MRRKKSLGFLCITLASAVFAAGCSANTEKVVDNTWEESGYAAVGKTLTVEKGDSPLDLLDNMDALTADGLYYAAWTMGDCEPYENSEGKTVDLYDAQLYLLLGEFKGEEEAKSNRDKWLDAGKSNYEILEEEEITCNGQDYTLITYNCVSEENPYARGVSAFGVYKDAAVCVEFTCREAFKEDLRTILVDFLDNCTYK